MRDLQRAPLLTGPDRAVEAGPAEILRSTFERCSERPAIVASSRNWTYAELAERATQHASSLKRHSVAPGARVGVFAEPSFDFYAAVLGIVGSGRTYVPLDPGYPHARLQYMVDDAALSCIFSESATQSIFGVPSIFLHADEDSRGPSRVAEPRGSFARAASDDEAYLIYTSGSTGKPKGVKVGRHALANLMLAQGHAFRVTHDDRVLQFASVCFDASVSEIFVTLGAGAALIVPEANERLGARLERFLAENQVSMATLPPSISARLRPDHLPDLHTIISAGEPCPPGFASRWDAGRRYVLNAYGPTESTVCATVAELQADAIVTLGEPLANVTVAVIDEEKERARTGEVGEIVIAGDGLANGYVGAVSNQPFCVLDIGRGPERCYRTGDMGSIDHLGRLQYRGRRDDQVKRNGVRIELGELEAALASHPEVVQAVAVFDSTTSQLDAFITTTGPIDTPDVRSRLQRELPTALLPSRITVLDSIPLAPTGKVDRRALAFTTAAEAAPDERTATQMELRIAEIWSRFLGVDSIGLHQNFFELGGNSLHAAMILSETNAFGVFDSPIIAQSIAEQVRSRRDADNSNPSIGRRTRMRTAG